MVEPFHLVVIGCVSGMFEVGLNVLKGVEIVVGHPRCRARSQFAREERLPDEHVLDVVGAQWRNHETAARFDAQQAFTLQGE